MTNVWEVWGFGEKQHPGFLYVGWEHLQIMVLCPDVGNSRESMVTGRLLQDN